MQVLGEQAMEFHIWCMHRLLSLELETIEPDEVLQHLCTRFGVAQNPQDQAALVALLPRLSLWLHYAGGLMDEMGRACY